MRNSQRRLASLSLFLTATAAVVACGGGASAKDTTAAKMDSAAAPAAATPAPPSDSYALEAKDGSWSADISPGGIEWHRTKGKKDSLAFDYKAPSVDGGITSYEIVRTVPDTHTFAAKLAMTPCTDSKKNSYTYLAQVWVDRVQYSGCANKK